MTWAVGDWSSAACVTTAARGLPWTTDAADLPTVVVDLMKAACASCPVRGKCEQAAETARGGFWAGADRDPWGDRHLWEPDPWQAVQWLPIEDQAGHLLGEQAALPLDLLGGAA